MCFVPTVGIMMRAQEYKQARKTNINYVMEAFEKEKKSWHLIFSMLLWMNRSEDFSILMLWISFETRLWEINYTLHIILAFVIATAIVKKGHWKCSYSKFIFHVRFHSNDEFTQFDWIQYNSKSLAFLRVENTVLRSKIYHEIRWHSDEFAWIHGSNWFLHKKFKCI